MSETKSATASALDRLFAGGCVLCDGAMGTMLYDRGISIDRCCDELNLSLPEAVASIHAAYLQSGAEIVETNTFGGNAFRLGRYELGDKVREINLAGVRIARQCVRQNGRATWVAGAVGPLGVRAGPGEAHAAFAEQIGALAEGGADLLTIETMMSLAEAGEAIRVAHEVAPGLRLVVMVTVGEDGNCLDGASPETAAARLTDLGADAVGCNCSGGPLSVLRAVERMRAATGLPLAAMPNAGLPQVGLPQAVGGRYLYAVSPEEMAEFVPKFLRAGATLIGGCCGTTPEHTRTMGSAMRAIEGPGGRFVE